MDEGDTDDHNDGHDEGGSLRETTPPPHIYKGIQKLQDETIHNRTTAVLQLPGPAGPMSRLAGIAPEGTHPPSARTTKLSH